MSAPFLDPRRKRSLLYNQAVVRAVDTLRGGGQVGANTLARLRTTTAAGGRNVGVDPSQLLQAFAAQSPDNPNLAGARQQALTNWAGQGLFSGSESPHYQAPPGLNPETFGQLRDAPASPAMTPPGPAEAIAARRADLLGRRGADAISSDLRKRILARMQRR
jgi:hypothetical protein